MKNFVKVGMIVFCFIFFFSVSNSFAVADNQQIDISNPEFSEMDKNQDGLMSCTEMQTYQPAFTQTDFNQMDKNSDGMISEAEFSANYNSPQ